MDIGFALSLGLVIGVCMGILVTLACLTIAKESYQRTFRIPTGAAAPEIIETEALPFVVKDDAKEAQLEKEFIAQAYAQPEVYDSVSGLGQ